MPTEQGNSNMTIWKVLAETQKPTNEMLACSLFHSLLVFQLQPMTYYHLTPSSPLSSFATQEAKAKRRHVFVFDQPMGTTLIIKKEPLKATSSENDHEKGYHPRHSRKRASTKAITPLKEL